MLLSISLRPLTTYLFDDSSSTWCYFINTSEVAWRLNEFKFFWDWKAVLFWSCEVAALFALFVRFIVFELLIRVTKLF